MKRSRQWLFVLPAVAIGLFIASAVAVPSFTGSGLPARAVGALAPGVARAAWEDYGYSSYDDCMFQMGDDGMCWDGSGGGDGGGGDGGGGGDTYGCTDSGANNYNSSANVDDGSCSYNVYGCTDSSATNYNSSANVNDGSCSYNVYGCTDSSANNYNGSANIDDGSCSYPSSTGDSIVELPDGTLYALDGGNFTYGAIPDADTAIALGLSRCGGDWCGVTHVNGLMLPAEAAFGSVDAPGTQLDLLGEPLLPSCLQNSEPPLWEQFGLSRAPTKAECSTAIKVLTKFDTYCQKYRCNLSPRRLAELKAKRDAGTITIYDLPATIRHEFPGIFGGLTLDQIRRICRQI
jgi:hypothetical protein